MSDEILFARVLDQAPHVKCQRCMIEMTLRDLHPTQPSDSYSATYRCPQCGTDQQRNFVPQMK